jgi:hypothetical protein
LKGPKETLGKKWVIVAVILDVPKAFDTLWVKGLHSPSNQMHQSFDEWGLKRFRVDLSPGPLCRQQSSRSHFLQAVAAYQLSGDLRSDFSTGYRTKRITTNIWKSISALC